MDVRREALELETWLEPDEVVDERADEDDDVVAFVPSRPPAKIVVLPRVVTNVEEPEVTVETRADVVIADEEPPYVIH